MRRLTNPNLSFSDVLAECFKGVGSFQLKIKYRSGFTSEVAAAIQASFQASALAGSLYMLPRTATGAGDIQVQGRLRKSDLMKLYTQYLVPTDKPGRRLHDELKITPNGKCPLCGDIGQVQTLDHYLPKANFPLYSVMPDNLIPCCRDCNSEKLNSFPTTQAEQTLNPYFDHEKFFSQQWVGARVIPGVVPVIEYYVSPPDNWSTPEKSRAVAHFSEYRLAERFGIEAGADLPETIYTRQTTLRNYSWVDYADYLLEKSNNLNLPVNNWRRVMFRCLANDKWFCNYTF